MDPLQLINYKLSMWFNICTRKLYSTASDNQEDACGYCTVFVLALN